MTRLRFRLGAWVVMLGLRLLGDGETRRRFLWAMDRVPWSPT